MMPCLTTLYKTTGSKPSDFPCSSYPVLFLYVYLFLSDVPCISLDDLFITCFSLPEWKLFEGRDFAVLTGVSMCLEQCLVHSGHLINIYRMLYEMISSNNRTQKK